MTGDPDTQDTQLSLFCYFMLFLYAFIAANNCHNGWTCLMGINHNVLPLSLMEVVPLGAEQSAGWCFYP